MVDIYPSKLPVEINSCRLIGPNIYCTKHDIFPPLEKYLFRFQVIRFTAETPNIKSKNKLMNVVLTF
jgi:hypothetical protein